VTIKDTRVSSPENVGCLFTLEKCIDPLPLKTGDILFGFIGFEAVRERRDWTDQVIELGRTIGDLIGVDMAI